MAKQKGLFKIEGTIDGVTFYKSPDGHLVRKSGGVSKKRIMKDAAFVRTRENITEFGNNAKAAKILRDAMGTLVNRAKDSRVSNRLMQIFNQIKDYDTESARGSRSIALALEEQQARNLLVGFDFNANAQMRNILKVQYEWNPADGQLVISAFSPLSHLMFPEGATHATMTLASVGLDFDTSTSGISQSAPMVIDPNAEIKDVSMNAAPISGFPIVLGVLLVEFFQEVNGVQYPLHNGAYNALNILSVEKTP